MIDIASNKCDGVVVVYMDKVFRDRFSMSVRIFEKLLKDERNAKIDKNDVQSVAFHHGALCMLQVVVSELKRVEKW